MNVYLFIIVPAMAIMCGVCLWIIVGDARAIWRSIMGGDKYESIKHRTGRNYGQAAVFIGTACLYMGTPSDCDELADDLWHRGVQAEVHELTGEETQFDII